MCKGSFYQGRCLASSETLRKTSAVKVDEQGVESQDPRSESQQESRSGKADQAHPTESGVGSHWRVLSKIVS